MTTRVDPPTQSPPAAIGWDERVCLSSLPGVLLLTIGVAIPLPHVEFEDGPIRTRSGIPGFALAALIVMMLLTLTLRQRADKRVQLGGVVLFVLLTLAGVSQLLWETVFTVGFLPILFKALSEGAVSEFLLHPGRELRFMLLGAIGVAMLAWGVAVHAFRRDWASWRNVIVGASLFFFFVGDRQWARYLRAERDYSDHGQFHYSPGGAKWMMLGAAIAPVVYVASIVVRAVRTRQAEHFPARKN